MANTRNKGAQYRHRNWSTMTEGRWPAGIFRGGIQIWDCEVDAIGRGATDRVMLSIIERDIKAKKKGGLTAEKKTHHIGKIKNRWF